MNQKQKDLLCNMLKDQVGKLRCQVEDRFPLQSWETGYYVLRRLEKSVINSLPEKDRSTYASLKKRWAKLSEQEKALNAEWDALSESLVALKVAERDKIADVHERLKDAEQTAVIKIQFAENADEANQILASLPSIEELLGE